MRPGKNGGQLKTGNPGNAGGGRRPNWIEDWCDEMLADEGTRETVQQIMVGRKNPKAFAAMWKALSERAFGRVPEKVEHSGTVNHKHQVWKLGDREVSF